jgi:hypothetical protein
MEGPENPTPGFPSLPPVLEIALRFPHSHRSDDEADGKVDNQDQVFHFPTATHIFSYAATKQKRRRRASPSPKKVLKVIVVDKEK